jgi:hypothetical protein
LDGDGFGFSFAAEAGTGLFGMMHHDSWNITSDESYPFTYSFDQGKELRALARRSEGSQSNVTFVPENSEEFFVGFFERRNLEIYTKQETYVVSLPHSQQSLDWIGSCFDRLFLKKG